MIDWQRVRELRDEVGEEAFGEVVQLFVEEASEVVDRLRQGVPAAQLEGDLHFLKGSVINLGFETVGTLCQQGETLAAKGAADQVDLPAILGAFDTAVAAFLAQVEAGHAA